MTHMKKILPFLLLMAAMSPAAGQGVEESEADASVTEEAALPESGASPGNEAGGQNRGNDNEDESIYVAAIHGDWEIRCAVTEGEPELCQLYQLVSDETGNPVIEVNILPLPDDPEFVAVATVVTPLETLLTEALEMSIDEGEVSRRSFEWCSEFGCVTRFGLTDFELADLKRGLRATLTIVAAFAPDHKMRLTASLTGFTAAFNDAVTRSRQ